MIDQHPNNNHDQPRFFLVSFNCSLTQKHSSQIRAIKYFSVKEKKVRTWQGQTIGLLIDCRLINNSASFRAVARTLICLVYPPFLSTRRRNLTFVIMLITVFSELSLFGAAVAGEHDVRKQWGEFWGRLAFSDRSLVCLESVTQEIEILCFLFLRKEESNLLKVPNMRKIESISKLKV